MAFFIDLKPTENYTIMQKELDELNQKIDDLESQYMFRRKTGKIGLQEMGDNARLSSEFLKEGADELIAVANRLIGDSTEDADKLQAALEEVLKNRLQEIAVNIVTGD